MNEKEIQKELERFCKNDMVELKKICYPLMVKIGGISQMDYDDFYGIALDVLADSVIKYTDNKCKFSTYLIGNINKRFKSEVRNRNRSKRIPIKAIISYDSYINNDEIELKEVIPSKFDLEKMFIKEEIDDWHPEVKNYLNNLSPLQRKVILMIADGNNSTEIQKKLNITKNHYKNLLNGILDNEKIKPLRKLM